MGLIGSANLAPTRLNVGNFWLTQDPEESKHFGKLRMQWIQLSVESKNDLLVASKPLKQTGFLSHCSSLFQEMIPF